MALRATKTNLERRYTTAEFELLPEFNGPYELIDGRLVEKPMPEYDHSLIARLISRNYDLYDPTEQHGQILQEVRMRRQNGDYLIPDLSFWVAERRPRRGVATPDAPDLAIEIQSPGQSLAELTGKARAYLEEGVRLVWIIQPGKQLVAVLRQGQATTEVIQPDGTLDGEDVIPGFTLPLRNLFQD